MHFWEACCNEHLDFSNISVCPHIFGGNGKLLRSFGMGVWLSFLIDSFQFCLFGSFDSMEVCGRELAEVLILFGGTSCLLECFIKASSCRRNVGG